MTKYTFFAIIAVLAVVTKAASSEKLSVLDKIIGIVDDKIYETLLKIEDTVDAVKRNTDKVVSMAKKNVEEDAKSIDNKLKEMENEFEEAVSRGREQHVNAQECIKFLSMNDVRNAVRDFTESTESCIDKQLEEAATLVQNLTISAQHFITELKAVREEIHECSGFLCTLKVKAKAMEKSGKSIGVIVKQKLKLKFMILSLPVNLAICTASDSFDNIRKSFDIRLRDVKNCVEEKINQYDESNDETTPPIL